MLTAYVVMAGHFGVVVACVLVSGKVKGSNPRSDVAVWLWLESARFTTHVYSPFTWTKLWRSISSINYNHSPSFRKSQLIKHSQIQYCRFYMYISPINWTRLWRYISSINYTHSTSFRKSRLITPSQIPYSSLGYNVKYI